MVNAPMNSFERQVLPALPANLQAELAKITQQPQRQDGAIDQLNDLRAFANKLGLYDAADLIRSIMNYERLADERKA